MGGVWVVSSSGDSEWVLQGEPAGSLDRCGCERERERSPDDAKALVLSN